MLDMSLTFAATVYQFFIIIIGDSLLGSDWIEGFFCLFLELRPMALLVEVSTWLSLLRSFHRLGCLLGVLAPKIVDYDVLIDYLGIRLALIRFIC